MVVDEKDDNEIIGTGSQRKKEPKGLSPNELRQRAKLVESIAAQKRKTLQERVCWLLNNFSATRNSDITLQLRYWAEFESDIYKGQSVSAHDLYRLTPLTSLTRARAKIQNQYGLFLAKTEVRKRRKTLEGREYEKQIETIEDYPSITVFADESGKVQEHFVVGSVWFLDSRDTLRFTQEVARWKDSIGFHSEFHFKELNDENKQFYIAFVELAMRLSTSISFRYVTVPRRGLGNVQNAFKKLYTLLMLRGLEHDLKVGRVTLPRALSLWKDAEELGADKMMLAEIRTELDSASASRWERKLFLETFEAVSSEKNTLVQLSDLFTSAVSRSLNRKSSNSSNAKDVVSDAILNQLGALSSSTCEFESDVAAKLFI